MTRRNWYLSAFAILLVIGAIAIGGFVVDFMKTFAKTDIRTENLTGVAKVIRSGNEVYGILELRSRSGLTSTAQASLGKFDGDTKARVVFDKKTGDLEFTYGNRKSTCAVVE